jgi:N-acetylmuramic acid 6-phosphate etherase
MIRIGRVEDTRMVNMQLTNSKLIDRGTRMLMNQTGITDYETAKKLLVQYGSVKKAAENRRKQI